MKEKGVSTLVLVFIIAILLAMIIFVLHPISLLATRRANQLLYSQTAFFAAEGAMYETIQHLRDNPDWPSSLPYEDPDPYFIDETQIKRIISDLGEGKIEIDITATIKGRRRRLIAIFSREKSEERNPLDIALIIDRSGSMDDAGYDDDGYLQPITDAIEAANAFSQVMADYHQEDTDDRIGLIVYSDTASTQIPLEEYPFTNIFNTLQPGGISTGSTTNIGGGLLFAKKELFEDSHRPDAIQIVVLLTDGVANRGYNEDESGNPLSIFECTAWPASATDCTNYALDKGTEIKNAGAIVYTIGLNFNWIKDNYGESVANIAEETIKSIATSEDHFFRTEVSGELENIFEEIASVIISPEFIEYQEEAPEPD